MSEILIIEPFYGGSHKQMIDLLSSTINKCDVITMPAKKWHWRARTSALYLSQQIPFSTNYRVLFTSSVLNLTELVALRPDLQNLHKILYFHENQLIYPVKKQQERDFQYGYNQILSCLVADVVVFNSQYNMESFLSSINSFLKLIPDHRPKGLSDIIRPKCQVLYFPLELPPLEENTRHKLELNNSLKLCDDELIKRDNLNQMSSHSKNSKYDCDTNSVTDTCDHPQIFNTTFQEKGGNFEVNEHKCKNLDRIQTKCNTHSVSSLQTKETIPKANIHEDKKDNLNLESSDEISRDILNIESSNKKGDNLSIELSTAQGDNCEKSKCNQNAPLHIVWAHRWEHDKDPESFFSSILELSESGCNFHISVLGEQFTDVPEIFTTAKQKLKQHIVNWGYQANKGDYFDILKSADVAVSTALHEFFGVSMLEAVYCGCYPLCPNRLVYPEIFTGDYLYNTNKQMIKTLKRFCKFPSLVRDHECKVQYEKYLWKNLSCHYIDLLKAEKRDCKITEDENI